jgi:hypothetical protein
MGRAARSFPLLRPYQQSPSDDEQGDRLKISEKIVAFVISDLAQFILCLSR